MFTKQQIVIIAIGVVTISVVVSLLIISASMPDIQVSGMVDRFDTPSSPTSSLVRELTPTEYPESTQEATASSSPNSPTLTSELAETPSLRPAPTVTASLDEANGSSQLSESETQVPESQLSSDITGEKDQGQVKAIIIDHRSVDKFEHIPDNYIQAASNLRLLFRHASVGQNINDGLDCMMNNFEKRPHRCDRDVPPGEISFDNKYDRSNWTFEFHRPPPGQNPGWWNKVNFFVERIDNLSPNETYDVASFKFGYVDAVPGSNIVDEFFSSESDNDLSGIQDLEALEARHPDMTFVLWSLCLARSVGTAESDNFNQKLRDYVNANGKILMDIADIQSHRPDGSPCIDNNGQGHEALCQEYTQEVNGGHLNARGQQRMAKAVWVLMAALAGWDGVTSQ